MRPRHAITWFLILTLIVPVHVRAADSAPASAPAGAAAEDKAADKTAAQPDDKSAVTQVPGGAEKIVALEEWVELAENPDWLLVIAGIAIAFWGTNQITGDIGNLLTSSLPAGVKLSRLFNLLKIGEEAQKELMAMAEELKPLGKQAKVAADALREHVEKIPKGIRGRPTLEGRRIGEIRDALSKPEVRDAINATKDGRKWLTQYDERLKAHDQGLGRMMDRFMKGVEALHNFSDKINEAGKGYFRQEDLAHRPMRYAIKPMEWGPPGALAIVADGGFVMEGPDPSQFHLLMHNPMTKCADLMARVGIAKDRAMVGAQSSALLAPLGHLAVVGLGYSIYRFGGWLIRSRTQSTPDELVAKAQNEAKASAVRELFKSGELVNVTEQVREYRSSGKDADVKEVYRVLREVLRKKLPEMAKDIRRATNPMLRDQADFESNLWSFMQNDDNANAILDSALAEAGQLELKTMNPESLHAAILSGDPATQAQVDRVLMRTYGTSLKFIWPKMSVEASGLPVDAARIAEAVNESSAPLQQIIQARKKRLGVRADATPVKATGATTDALVPPSVVPAAAETVKPAVGG